MTVSYSTKGLGQLVEAMILNGLGFVGRTLHMYPEYVADRPVERLIDKGVKAEHINDDALGRCRPITGKQL